MLERVLVAAREEVVAAADGAQARALCRRRGAEVGAVVVVGQDRLLPRRHGRLLQIVCAPPLLVVLLDLALPPTLLSVSLRVASDGGYASTFASTVLVQARAFDFQSLPPCFPGVCATLQVARKARAFVVAG